MKSTYCMIAFVVLLAACAPESSQFIQPTSTVDVAPTPSDVAPTAESSPTPAVSAETVTELGAQLGGITLSQDGAGGYSFELNGKKLDNISLNADGYVHLVAPDGEQKLPWRTVFRDGQWGATELHASQYRLQLDTSEVSTIDIKETKEQRDFVRMTIDQVRDGTWARWVRSTIGPQNVSQSKVPFVTKIIDSKNPPSMDLNKDGEIDSFGANVFVPNTVSDTTLTDHPSLKFSDMGFLARDYFTHIVGGPEEPSFSIFPNLHPIDSQSTALFAQACDTKDIQNNLSELSEVLPMEYSLKDPSGKRYRDVALPATFATTDTNINIMSIGSQSQTFVNFLQGNVWDAADQVQRQQILTDPNFSGSDRIVWPTYSIGVYE